MDWKPEGAGRMQTHLSKATRTPMSNFLARNVNPTPTINWTGESGKSYGFWLYPIGTKYLALPGVYIFTGRS